MKCKLSDIAIITMGQSPKGSSYNSNKNGKPFLQGRKTFGRIYPDIDTWTTEPNRMAQQGSILMSVRAPVGDVNIANTEVCIGRGLCSINAKNGNNKYLYYLLLNNKSNIVNKSSGTVFDSINKEQLENFEINIHNDNEQTKISNILSRIDEKIELNMHTNNNLLQIIENYYKDIFKATNNVKRADEIANITIGKTPPRAIKECFSNSNKDIKWLSISDIGKCGLFALETNEKLTQEAVNQYNVKIVPKGTIVLSFKLTVGRVAITNEEMTTNEAIAHFDLYDKRLRNYIYFYLKNFDYGKLGSTSSIATAVNSKIIKSMSIIIPNEEELLKFNNLSENMFNIIRNKEVENKRLEQIRDTLLPKLMNGEIDLDKIEI